MTVHSLCTGLIMLRRKNIRDFSLAAFLFCLILGCSSTNEIVQISGSLTDAHDGKPIAGQEVVLYKFEESYVFFIMGSFVPLASIKTGQNGRFEFEVAATEELFIWTTACDLFGEERVDVPRERSGSIVIDISYDEEACSNKPSSWE